MSVAARVSLCPFTQLAAAALTVIIACQLSHVKSLYKHSWVVSAKVTIPLLIGKQYVKRTQLGGKCQSDNTFVNW